MAPWDKENPPLLLLTPKEYEQLPDGAILESINKEIVTKGVDYIDQDTRFGHLAFGIRDVSVQPEDVQKVIETLILKT